MVLNGRVNSGTYTPVGGSSLAQYAVHGPSASIYGGESIYSYFIPPGAVQTEDLTALRDIGNSILGGGLNLNVPTSPVNLYPDGPDVLTVCCTNITNQATNTINSRISWTEAQA